jgi:hypothetical protein
MTPSEGSQESATLFTQQSMITHACGEITRRFCCAIKSIVVVKIAQNCSTAGHGIHEAKKSTLFPSDANFQNVRLSQSPAQHALTFRERIRRSSNRSDHHSPHLFVCSGLRVCGQRTTSISGGLPGPVRLAVLVQPSHLHLPHGSRDPQPLHFGN